jgi:phenylacetate-CoA ligase
VAVSAPQDYAAAFDARVASVLPDAARRIDGLGARLRAAGVEPGELVDVASLDRLPVLAKDELVDLQAQDPPFGGLLSPEATPRRLFQSPGPIYEPDLGGSDPWGWAPALRAAGLGPGDRVLNAFAYHLTPAGAMFEEAAVAIGSTVFPGGVGSVELQARACRDLGITAYIGLPSYLKALLEKADEVGLDPASWPLERAFLGAEPLPPSLRSWLEARVPVVRQGYGTAETGNLGYECEAREGMHVPEDRLVEVCDLATGEGLWDGREGEVVVTVLSPDYPLVRLGTGDLSAYLTEPCGCGIATPRIAGWLGRVGEAVKVRGMFLHPRQAQAALGDMEGIERFRFVVDRVEHRDALRCEVGAGEGTDGSRLRSAARDRIRSALRFDAEVVVVERLDPDAPAIADLRSWD